MHYLGLTFVCRLIRESPLALVREEESEPEPEPEPQYY